MKTLFLFSIKDHILNMRVPYDPSSPHSLIPLLGMQKCVIIRIKKTSHDPDSWPVLSQEAQILEPLVLTLPSFLGAWSLNSSRTWEGKLPRQRCQSNSNIPPDLNKTQQGLGLWTFKNKVGSKCIFIIAESVFFFQFSILFFSYMSWRVLALSIPQ